MVTKTDPEVLYLDLLKDVLHGVVGCPGERWAPVNKRGRLGKVLAQVTARTGIAVARRVQEERPEEVQDGSYSRALDRAYTMIGRERLDNVQHCIRTVLADGIPGDLIETGVWRGGTAIFMRALLKLHKAVDRRVFVADSFQGLPAPNLHRYPNDSFSDLHERDDLAIPLEKVRDNFDRLGLLDDEVVFVKGWFRDTLPRLTNRVWAVMRLDGDLYESTMDGLRNLYPNLSPGGFVIVDDYGAYGACRRAVEDYRAENGITEPIERIDWAGAFWRRQQY